MLDVSSMKDVEILSMEGKWRLPKCRGVWVSLYVQDVLLLAVSGQYYGDRLPSTDSSNSAKHTVIVTI
jgi:hypothetical protein